MTPDQRAELRRLRAAATALPWTVDKDDVLGKDGRHVAWSAGVPMRGLPNVAYIVAAANAMPALLDELEEATEALDAESEVSSDKDRFWREAEAKLAAAEARVKKLEATLRKAIQWIADTAAMPVDTTELDAALKE